MIHTLVVFYSYVPFLFSQIYIYIYIYIYSGFALPSLSSIPVIAFEIQFLSAFFQANNFVLKVLPPNFYCDGSQRQK